MKENTLMPSITARTGQISLNAKHLRMPGGMKNMNMVIAVIIRTALGRWTGAPPCSLSLQPAFTSFSSALMHKRSGVERYEDQNGSIMQRKTHGIKHVQASPAMKEPAICIRMCSISGRIAISDQNGIMPRPALAATASTEDIFPPK